MAYELDPKYPNEEQRRSNEEQRRSNQEEITGALDEEEEFEDIDEAVYRIDRMLRQLLLAGLLDGVRAIVFGACTNCPEASDDGARRLDDVIAEVADLLAVPAMSGAPVGHIDEQWTLPLGAAAALDTDQRTLAVQPTLTIA